MTQTKLEYVGAGRSLPTAPERKWWQKIPLSLLIVVGAPTLIAAIYYFGIASPQYVSEARFTVRSANQSQPSSIGIALQGVGLSPAATDSFAVHEFINSRDGLNYLEQRIDVKSVFAPPNADMFSRSPRLWEGHTEEDKFSGLKRFVTVGYDSSTGISTLRVKAFSPNDASAVANALLDGGENVVNSLNERSSNNAIIEARAALERARAKVDVTQTNIAEFRAQRRFLDPENSARESGSLIANLRSTLANLNAERSQLMSEAPNSPQLPILNGRIASYERQIADERAKIVGEPGSLAPQIGVYEDLMMRRELAGKEFAAATTALTSAEQDSRRQKLYLERIVRPNTPDKAIEPQRLIMLLTIFLSTLLAYGLGWLVYAGVREHRQT
ncbi:chain-length determining protein [Brevundimonas sp.]|jgi:capsular polysaccharide transport system permease protein|uniref:chain-length determining protein n=1 Tax=Brevundimonas sp. TaxID=1871086 RepID=UPI0017B282BF|nr:chain-length determining protein [Brevundimonas sp.]MBA4807185.1 chain-length determining protein [Brevundimonas sp.]